MVKKIGVFLGFFLVMLVVAAMTTGVWQQGILPRLKGAWVHTVPAVSPTGPGPQELHEPNKPNQPPEPKEGTAPTEPEEAKPSMEEQLKQEREALAAEGRRLAQLKATIEKLLKEEEAREEARLQHLAKLYERMRPKEAAAAIEKLDRALAARLLTLMGERQAAKILEALDGATAADLSRQLSPPREGSGREP